MPIIQVRAQYGEQFMAVPATHKEGHQIIAEWRKDMWQSEMYVYPPNYAGDVTPQGKGWETHSFMLSVDEAGEQAYMMAVGKLWNERESAAALDQLRTLSPEYAARISNVATINESRRSFLIAIALNPSTIAVGGIMMHVRPPELQDLRTMFRTTDIEPEP